MAAEWIEFDPSAIFPDEMAALVSAVEDTVDALVPAIQLLADAVRVAALFAQDLVDAQEAVISAMQDAIYQAVQQLTQTGIFWTFHMPVSLAGPIEPYTWLNDLALSFDDRMDPERPILVTPAFVGAVAVAVTTVDYADLFKQFRALFDLFNKLIASADQVDHWYDDDNPFEVIPGVGKAPNWGNMTLVDVIPPIADLVDLLLSFADSISAARSGLLDDFADFLDQKAAIFQQIADQIEEILDTLLSLLDVSGAWLLPIYGEFDTEDIKTLLRTAEGGPLGVSGASYTAGVMFLATGGTSSSVAADALFDLFGLAKEVTEI